jgi:hypothetical protein
MASRQVHDMKARSSELDAPIKNSTQTVTHCGIERAVLVPSKRTLSSRERGPASRSYLSVAVYDSRI